MDHGGGSMGNMTMPGDFCQGSGRVMLMGFQASFEQTSACILYLFQGAVVDSAVKYAFAVIGTFLLALVVELLGFVRKQLMAAGFMQERRVLRALVIAFVYGVNMLGAYWLMLLVMTYEAVIFSAIVFGLAVGHALVVFFANPKSPVPSGTPCCGGSESYLPIK